MSDAIKSEFSAVLRQKGFLIAMTIVAFAAIGLRATTKAVGLHFKKERVELRKPLDVLPKMMGSWLQVSKDQALPEEQEHALGTKDYLTRGYIDTRAISGFDLKRWEAMDEQTRANAVRALMAKSPQSYVSLHMAYYTGLVDTVAHVPERCYVAGGYDPVNPQVLTLEPFAGVPGRNPKLKVRYTEFVDRSKAQPTIQNVAYFFHVNGSYQFDSIGGVRLKLQDIREKYAYYCKIEMLTQVGENPELARQTMSSLMTAALPEIEKCLPDWEKVTGKHAELNEWQ